MRRVLQYHEWRADWWETLSGTKYEHLPDFREGANAYAHRQATLSRALGAFCGHSWRHVKAWVCLGAPIPDGEAAESDDENLPDLASISSTTLGDDDRDD